MKLTPLQRMGALNLIAMAVMLMAGEWMPAVLSACAALIGLWPRRHALALRALVLIPLTYCAVMAVYGGLTGTLYMIGPMVLLAIPAYWMARRYWSFLPDPAR